MSNSSKKEYVGEYVNPASVCWARAKDTQAFVAFIPGHRADLGTYAGEYVEKDVAPVTFLEYTLKPYQFYGVTTGFLGMVLNEAGDETFEIIAQPGSLHRPRIETWRVFFVLRDELFDNFKHAARDNHFMLQTA